MRQARGVARHGTYHNTPKTHTRTNLRYFIEQRTTDHFETKQNSMFPARKLLESIDYQPTVLCQNKRILDKKKEE